MAFRETTAFKIALKQIVSVRRNKKKKTHGTKLRTMEKNFANDIKKLFFRFYFGYRNLSWIKVQKKVENFDYEFKAPFVWR